MSKGLDGISPKITNIADHKPAKGKGGPLEFDLASERREPFINDMRERIAAGNEAFRFGEAVVIVRETVVADPWSDPDAPTMVKTVRPVVLSPVDAGGPIEKVARFYKETKEAVVWKAVPDWARAAACSPAAALAYKPLRGVIRHPVILSDGTLLHGRLGWVESLGMWVDAPLPDDCTSFNWPSAAFAYEWLRSEWLGEFEFATPADAARAISLALALLVNRTILANRGGAPGLLADAPLASSGKTELMLTLTLGATGELPLPIQWTNGDEAEMSKSLIAAGLVDPPGALLDNIPNGAAVASTSLDQWITDTTYGGRLLGANKNVTVPSLAILMGSGNNIEPGSDSATRFLSTRLETKTDQPQNRQFKHDIRQRTVHLRPAIISALVTIYREGRAGGVTVKRAGRFAGWFAHVAVPIIRASGAQDMLDPWRKASPTVRNAGGLAEFLEAVDGAMRRTGLKSMSSAEVIVYCAEEYADLVGDKLVPPHLVQEAARDDDDGEPEAIKARERARRRLAKGVMKNLSGWRDQGAGGLRLRLVEQRDARNGRDRVFLRAEPMG